MSDNADSPESLSPDNGTPGDSPGSSKAMPNAGRRDSALKNLDRVIKGRERKAKSAPMGVMAATVLVLALIVGGIYFATTYTSSDDSSTDAADQNTENQELPDLPAGPLEAYPATVSCTYDKEGDSAKDVDAPKTEGIATEGIVKVALDTSAGLIPIQLDRSTSPCTVNNFETLVEQDYFNDTVCHRHVKSAGMGILQCGDPTGTGSGGPGYKFADEYPLNGVAEAEQENPLTYPRGTLAMANSGPGTNGSQFFLVTQDTILPPLYNVFGTIDEEGLSTLDDIAEKSPEGDGAPGEEVKITTARIND